jgi:hypothetical protein
MIKYLETKEEVIRGKKRESNGSLFPFIGFQKYGSRVIFSYL